MTLTLTLDRVILGTIVHHSSTSTYMPNFIEIEGTFCGRFIRTYVRTYVRTDGQTFETGFIWSTLSWSRKAWACNVFAVFLLLVSTVTPAFTGKARSTLATMSPKTATMSKQHCRMLQVERFFRQCLMLLRHCCRFWRQCCRFGEIVASVDRA